jgi:hypothetical protein
VLVDQSLAALGAIAAIVVRPVDGGGQLESAAGRGYPPEVMERWARFPVVGEGVMAETARERHAVWIPSVGDVEAARYPVSRRRCSGRAPGAFAAIPIDRRAPARRDRTAVPGERDWREEDRDLLGAIAAVRPAWSRAGYDRSSPARRAPPERAAIPVAGQATSAVEWTVDPAGAFVDPQPSWEAHGPGVEGSSRVRLGGGAHPDDRPGFTARWFQSRDARSSKPKAGSGTRHPTSTTT